MCSIALTSEIGRNTASILFKGGLSLAAGLTTSYLASCVAKKCFTKENSEREEAEKKTPNPDRKLYSVLTFCVGGAIMLSTAYAVDLITLQTKNKLMALFMFDIGCTLIASLT